MTAIRRLRHCAIALLAAIAVIGTDFNDPLPTPRVATAHADDDGGGRGGRGGRRGANRSDNDDGPRLFRPWRKRKARVRRAVRPAVVQAQYEPKVLIASGLSDTLITTLGDRGYTIMERHALGSGGALVKLRIRSGISMEAARQEVRSSAPEAEIDFNHYYRPDASECVGGRCLMRDISGWSMDAIPQGCTPRALIGLIDTRINLDHPALAESKITVLPLFDAEKDMSGAAHGTAVAALFVGRGDVPGLLQDWELVAVDAFRKGDIATGMDLARAIDMLMVRKVPIINMSLSGPDNAILATTVGNAIASGAVVIAAAGNDGPRAKPVFPAAYPDVIAVTAVDRNKRVYRRAARGEHIDIAAPGVNVWTAASVKGQRSRTGTSFAAPFVSAAAALIMAENPGFTRKEVELVLENEASDLGDAGRDDVFGWGLLDIRRFCRG